MSHEGVQPRDDVQVLRTTRSHEGPFLKIDADVVRLPDGAETTLETIQHPGAAAALPFLDDGRVLLIRQYRHAMGGMILEVPAGKLDPGEAPDTCAFREVEEEVGYRPGRLIPLGAIFTTPAFTDEVIWLYEAHDLTEVGSAHEFDEVIETLQVPFDEALAMVQDGRIRDGKSVAAILHSFARR